MATEEFIFLEQAEYLEEDSLLRLSAEHPDETVIIRKLSLGGAKLITGPRGSGKTTLMLKTYYKLCANDGASSLPIYVNFKSSLKLEPLYSSNPNAVFWFNQWIILKVYQGLYSTIKSLAITDVPPLKVSSSNVEEAIAELEIGRTDIRVVEEHSLHVADLQADINTVLSRCGRTRCVLLLDDAAHAFSPSQQRDFFEFFRQVKSAVISPKAAIYPGVTTYSSGFHVGHDAEEIDIWIKPDSQGYLEFMLGLLERRLPEQVFAKLSGDQEQLNLICYAAFGMPRALLNIIRTLWSDESEEDREEYKVSFTRTRVLAEIKASFENAYGIYSTLSLKLPMYEKFVSAGETIFRRMIQSLKAYNRDKGITRQADTIAIRQPIQTEFSKVLGFFQYSGLVMPRGKTQRGVKGTFELYKIHYAALIDRNALFGKRTLAIDDYVKAFSSRGHQTYARVTPEKLLGTTDFSATFTLSLPPCHSCNAPRTNEHAKFCPQCGASLKTASVFAQVINQPIEKLPLTDVRIGRIKENSRIRTIKDILMDIDNRELLSVPFVGPVWAKRIYSYAEEFIA